MAGFIDHEERVHEQHASPAMQAHESASQEDFEDVKKLRKELRRLRVGGEILSMRVRKSRRELARTRKQCKEEEQRLAERREDVAALARRLGCDAEGLPEIDEWRELAIEHGSREKELRKQIDEEQKAHEKKVEELRWALKKIGEPDTAPCLEAREQQRHRRRVDERCAELQAVRDYVRGDMQDFSEEDLRGFLCLPEEDEENGQSEESFAARSDTVTAALEMINAQHQADVRDLVALSNAVINRKDAYLRELSAGVLTRGLQDIRLCAPAERAVLKELLVEAEAVVARRVGPLATE